MKIPIIFIDYLNLQLTLEMLLVTKFHCSVFRVGFRACVRIIAKLLVFSG